MEWRVGDGVLPLEPRRDRRYSIRLIVGFARILESLLCNLTPPDSDEEE